MFAFLRRIVGGQKAIGAVENTTQSVNVSDERVPFVAGLSLEDIEHESRSRLEAMSAQMPGGDYFALLEKLQNAISEKRYADAAKAAHLSITPLRDWLSDPRGHGERLHLRIPALQQGGTMMALNGDTKGLSKVIDLTREFDHLEPYRSDAEKHLKSAELFERIRQLVASKPGVLQNKVKAELNEQDGRHIGNLISWLVKAGEISRVQSGKTYALSKAELPSNSVKTNLLEQGAPSPSPAFPKIDTSLDLHRFLNQTYRFVALDVETANQQHSSICQVGLAMVATNGDIETISILVDPEQGFESFNVTLHGIDEITVKGAPSFKEVLQFLRPFLERHVLVQHSNFDKQAFNAASKYYSVPELRATWVDSVQIARKAWPELKGNGGHGLASLKTHLDLEFEHHDAEEDARAAAEVVLLAETVTGEDFSELAKPSKQKYQTSVAVSGNQNGPLYGHVACFTGQLAMSRVEAATFAAGAGITIKTGVSKKVTLLIVGDQDISTLAGHDKSSKHRRAEELQREGHEIRILGETEFLKLVAID
ncbi:exonuclease domain-containing protein [Sulfitobacter sp. S190]|uniref:exonuclease domain-containing protein n=1 Tax=Sulfitobacter sp. S190 TaxID=2867022 RepID=UPI0021A43F58|nr:exonuclease domain-containing protein [Sulfitobacter sp. S190]